MHIKTALTIAILCTVLVACGGGASLPQVYETAPPTHTITGDVTVIRDFPMPQLNRTRRIWIYVPADYAQSTTKYPVLYMQDGQNLFDVATSFAGEWGIDEAMLQMEQEDAKLKTIVVGIDNGGALRSDEYDLSAHAKEYVDFLVLNLKPYIDNHYRTLPDRDHTAIGGSSAGANLSLYAGLSHQDVFGKIAAFSPVTLYDNGGLQQFITQQGKQQDMRIYLDIGQLEESQFPGVVSSDQQTYNSLLALGFDTQSVSFVIDPAGAHNETSWRRRFPAAWKWLNL